MSKQSDLLPHVVHAKKFTHALFSEVKKYAPGIKLANIYEIVARLNKAKDWRTFAASDGTAFPLLFGPIPVCENNELIPEDLDRFYLHTVLPKITEYAGINGLVLLKSGPEGTDFEYGFRIPNLKTGREAGFDTEISLALKNSIKGYCFASVKLAVTRRGVFFGESDVMMGFPDSAAEVALRIVRSLTGVTGDLIELLVMDDGRDADYPIVTNLQGQMGMWSSISDGGDISTDNEAIEYLFRVISESFKGVGLIFKAYARYAGKWHSEPAITAFRGRLGDILSGEPRHRQVDMCCYETTIRKQRFRLILSGYGPYLECNDDGVELDKAMIVHVAQGERSRGPNNRLLEPGWHISKYGDSWQARIYLNGFAEKDMRLFGKEFGTKSDAEGWYRAGFDDFTESKAFKGLVEWMRANPKFAKEFKGKHYWYDRALEQTAYSQKESL